MLLNQILLFWLNHLSFDSEQILRESQKVLILWLYICGEFGKKLAFATTCSPISFTENFRARTLAWPSLQNVNIGITDRYMSTFCQCYLFLDKYSTKISYIRECFSSRNLHFKEFKNAIVWSFKLSFLTLHY